MFSTRVTSYILRILSVLTTFVLQSILPCILVVATRQTRIIAYETQMLEGKIIRRFLVIRGDRFSFKYDHRPLHPYNAGTEPVGRQPDGTMTALGLLQRRH